MRKLLPLILAVIGLAAGVGTGLALRPAPLADLSAQPESAAPGKDHSAPRTQAEPKGQGQKHLPEGGFDYVKLANQFVVPVVKDGKVTALIVLTLSLEVGKGTGETVYAREPKLRDGFLRVLFDHANAGGFDGEFTAPTKLATLRMALKEQAAQSLGPIVQDVLIMDMVRQDS